ncbi:hypothetical protein [Clostridium perfringens]|nr:hypothetical protein [Clostridium perfringens]MBI6033744.1 hypothetical protein [Clostridium perfringens]UUR88526.1 hypothetical protein NQ194_16570 [Clostridium perfringens]
MKKFLKDYIEDILIILGLLIINISVYMLNLKLGVFVTGVIFLVLGIYIAWKGK